MTNEDVVKLIGAAAERLGEDDYDAAMVHLKSALNTLALLKRRAKLEEKLPGVGGEVVGALVGLGADPKAANEAVKTAMRAGVNGFENLFRAANQSVRRAA